jgi:cardiolipin synthase
MFDAGIEVHEYQPTMIHAKTLVVDGQWNLIGSMNFDQRSMFLNEEVMLLVCDSRLAGDLERDFERDLGESRRFTMDEWKKRSASDRAAALAARLIQKQL